MNRLVSCVLLFLSVLVSCERRPLKEADYSVQLNIHIDSDVLNYTPEKDPELMRCVFYNSENGAFVTQAFLPSDGGVVNLLPSRTYDILVYNFGTKSTWIKDDDWFHKVYASTSLIPDSYRSKLRSRSSEDEEQIVYDPDHLFVGRIENVFIPARSVDAPMPVLDVEVKTVVETWKIEVSGISGIENIGSIAGVVSGLSRNIYIGIDMLSADLATVYFDTPVVDQSGFLSAGFNTFGHNVESDAPLMLSLVFIDIAGNGHTFYFDVTDQFVDNPGQVIRLDAEIDIPKPITSGDGGFTPEVGVWDDIRTEINI